MLEALQAERLKLARHRAAWLTVWIFPIGLVILAIVGTAVEIARPETPERAANAASWITNQAEAWQAFIYPLGRILVVAFTAVAFGGEYGWNTWKLVVPHRDRTMLLAAKYVVVLTMIAITAVLLVSGNYVAQLINDALTNEPTPSGVRFGAVLAAQGDPALIATVTTLLTVAYASAAAVLTRSTMAAAIIGIVLISLEQAARLLLAVNPTLYRWTPGHHLSNLTSWITDGRALTIPVTNPPISDSWQLSAAYLAVLIVGLVAVTIAAFRRQDLN